MIATSFQSQLAMTDNFVLVTLKKIKRHLLDCYLAVLIFKIISQLMSMKIMLGTTDHKNWTKQKSQNVLVLFVQHVHFKWQKMHNTDFVKCLLNKLLVQAILDNN
jgi:hypothetical protein